MSISGMKRRTPVRYTLKPKLYCYPDVIPIPDTPESQSSSGGTSLSPPSKETIVPLCLSCLHRATTWSSPVEGGVRGMLRKTPLTFSPQWGDDHTIPSQYFVSVATIRQMMNNGKLNGQPGDILEYVSDKMPIIDR